MKNQIPKQESNDTKKIKVLHPITRLIVGGAQENTLYTAEKLNHEIFKVDVLTGIQAGSEGSLYNEAIQRNIPIILLPELVREINPFFDLLAYKKLLNIINQKKYSIVHTHSSKAGILGRIAAHQAKVPVIIHTVHGWSFHDHMSNRSQWIYIILERLTANFSDALIAVSQKDIQKGIAAGIGITEKYHLIRSAIPLNEFKFEKFNRSEIKSELSIPFDAPVVGNVGRFSSQKNPADWVKVAKEISLALPGCYFLMIGDGPLKPAIESELRSAGIMGQTILTGLKRDIPRYLSIMDVFLLTSLWEGLPRTIPQAMSMKLPVISYQINGIEEAILHGKTGYLAVPGDIRKIGSYCIELLKDPQKRLEFGERGYQVVQKEFNLEIMIENITKLYQNLLIQKIDF